MYREQGTGETASGKAVAYCEAHVFDIWLEGLEKTTKNLSIQPALGQIFEAGTHQNSTFYFSPMFVRSRQFGIHFGSIP